MLRMLLMLHIDKLLTNLEDIHGNGLVLVFLREAVDAVYKTR